MKLVTRSQWGARDYRLPNGATLYSGDKRRGVKLHYLGSAYSDRTHDRCDDYVRQIQAQHMDGNGWSDIGYSFLVCTHGYVYEGRGLRRRNSANGSTALNEQDYAICLLVGSSGLTKPTDAQLGGARDAIDYCRREGPAGAWLGGHRDGYATSCPGDPIYAWVKAGAPRPTAPPEDDVALTDAEINKIADRAADLVVERLFKADVIAAVAPPDENADWHEGNTKWSFGYAVHSPNVVGRETRRMVRELKEKVDSLAVGGVDMDALAAKVADLLAARLAQ